MLLGDKDPLGVHKVSKPIGMIVVQMRHHDRLQVTGLKSLLLKPGSYALVRGNMNVEGAL